MNENNFIEVDSIRFETLVPKRVLVLPKRNLFEKFSYIFGHLFTPVEHPSPGYPVQIGMRITNNSGRPVYFSFYFTLFPEIIKAESGEAVELQSGWIHTPGPLKSDFILAMPGENINFFFDAKLCWLCGKNYGLSIIVNEGTVVFQPLHSESYQLRFMYENQKETQELYDSLSKQTKIIEGLWTGKILTPFVEIRLVRP